MSNEVPFSGEVWFIHNASPTINLIVEDFSHYQSPLVDHNNEPLGKPKNKIGFDLTVKTSGGSDDR